MAEHSAFHRALWSGKTPPFRLRDFPELPVSGQRALRVREIPSTLRRLSRALPEVATFHGTSATSGWAMDLLSARKSWIIEAVGGRCHRAVGSVQGVPCAPPQMPDISTLAIITERQPRAPVFA